LNKNSPKEQFRDYFVNNKGTLYKKLYIHMGTRSYMCDIYWGDPKIIFYVDSVKDNLPLAMTVLSKIAGTYNPRIYLHDKLELKYNSIFEMVVLHEIGHLWLIDIIGIGNQLTPNESEVWADYFAYRFFVKSLFVPTCTGSVGRD